MHGSGSRLLGDGGSGGASREAGLAGAGYLNAVGLGCMGMPAFYGPPKAGGRHGGLEKNNSLFLSNYLFQIFAGSR